MIRWPVELIDDIAKRNSVLYLGSGISAASKNDSGKSPATWRKFLEDILDARQEKLKTCHDTIKQLLDRGNYLTACEIIVRHLGERDFGELAADEFRRPGYRPNELHKIIFSLDSRLVITPNIDKIYEPRVISKNLIVTPKMQNIEMYTLTDRGRIRSNNEDSVIAISHPLDASIKLLAVADGMGGYNNGEIASSFTIDQLATWFKSLSLKDLKNMNYLEKSLNKVVTSINLTLQTKIKETKMEMGTTLCCAIVTNKKTLIGNIGDSRCYLLKDSNLEQITEDDSLAYYWYKQNYLLTTKDDIRFYKHNNQIFQGLGITDVELRTKVIDNNSYDKLLLLTDGVTDCLSDDRIKLIANTTRKEYILNRLIDEAVNKEQEIPQINLPQHLINYPIPGKDNATGALLIKK